MDEDTSKEVEAALIDAYPGLTNRMGSAGSNDRGVRHADQIIREHDAPEFELNHRLIMISVGKRPTRNEVSMKPSVLSGT